MNRIGALSALLMLVGGASPVAALERSGAIFNIYQFPADAIPRIDGKADDWAQVGGDYVVDESQLAADDGSGRRPDPHSLKVRVRVGWVKGLNRLYFLYEAYDDHWDFADPGLRNDIFELAVDGDRSGGPFIARFHPDLAHKGAAPSPSDLSEQQAWFGFQNIHAQNYHIFTPARDKDWAMAWGPQAQWIKRLPWSNIAYDYHFQPGQAGKLVMEFWITPFDRADPESAARSIETQLRENDIVAMAWAVIDRDGPGAPANQFWNLSPKHMMYGQASELCAFRLMPLEPSLRKPIAADWSFDIVDRDRRLVAFKDESVGVSEWRWDFGDGQISNEQNPVHLYAQPGKFVVILDVKGPAGTSRLSRVWDVSFVGDPPK